MERLPSEFADILSPSARRILAGDKRDLPGDLTQPDQNFLILSDAIDTEKAKGCLELFDRAYYGKLDEISGKIDKTWIAGMERNYSETLGKTMRVDSYVFSNPEDKLYQIGEEIGLLPMLRSESLLHFAEAATGLHLQRGQGTQITCNRPGHYIGPHNDHHPQLDWARDGYVDIQLVLANDAVEHQWLVHEENNYFSRIWNLNQLGAISVFRQPFWHFTTPLVAKPAREREARRWVVGQVFRIARRAQIAVPSVPAEEKVVLESRAKLSSSRIWDWQRRFYQKRGPSAWSEGVVPSKATTSPVIAREYARLALAFVQDQGRSIDVREPITVIELGAGSGRFGYLFIQKFNQLCKLAGLSDLPIRYVMTDLAESNVRQWNENRFLRPLIESGALLPALYDADAGTGVRIWPTGERLDPEGLKNPAIVIANYFFDSIVQDAFRVRDGGLEEGLMTVSCAAKHFVSIEDPGLIENASMKIEYQPLLDNHVYADPRWNRVLDRCRSELGDSEFLLPTGALRCIEELDSLCRGGWLLLVADKGYTDVAGIGEAKEISLCTHGSLSLMVNFRALELYTREGGGSSLLSAQERRALDVAAFAFVVSSSLTRTREAFESGVACLNPYDCLVLAEETMENANASTDAILAALRICEWDPSVFERFAEQLRLRAENLSSHARGQLMEGIDRVWAHHFSAGGPDRLAFEIATVLQMLSEPDQAARYYQEHLARFESDGDALHNLGLCAYQMGDLRRAVSHFERALKHDPERPRTVEWLSDVRTEIEALDARPGE